MHHTYHEQYPMKMHNITCIKYLSMNSILITVHMVHLQYPDIQGKSIIYILYIVSFCGPAFSCTNRTPLSTQFPLLFLPVRIHFTALHVLYQILLYMSFILTISMSTLVLFLQNMLFNFMLLLGSPV